MGTCYEHNPSRKQTKKKKKKKKSEKDSAL
jgi:hypothetical protein